jgi:hypothetical protein
MFDGPSYRVCCKSGAHSLAESRYAAAIFLRSIAQLGDGSARSYAAQS